MRAFLSVALGAATISSAIPCCVSYAAQVVSLTDETALIIWNEKAQTQSFIRKASFKGNAKDFGFILPVPSKPSEIEVADAEVFKYLELKKPTKKVRMADGVAASKAAGGVEVLEVKRVGDYEATVLRSDSGNAINKWLADRGHKMRPAMTPWFEHYTKKQWLFVAFKYANKGGAKQTEAVRVTCKTNKPYYPYKMPSDTWEKGHFRPLDLFVISQTDVLANYTNGKAWQANRSWSVLLDDSSRKRVASFLGKTTQNLLPAKATLTRFSNVSEANNYDYDLEFSPMLRKDSIVSTSVGVSVATAVVLGLTLRRQSRRRHNRL